MTSYAAIIAKYRPAAFGGVGIDSRKEAEHVASHYLHYRKGRRMSARAALEAAKALPAAYVPGKGWYGPTGGAGAADSDGLRWIENTASAGLRFVGWSDDLVRSIDHKGWFTFPEGDPGDTLRGGVWQLPGKGRHARLVAGYAHFEGRDEINPGSARVDCSTIRLADMRGEFGNIDEHDETWEAARAADGMAESAAETERDYQQAYQAGREAAEIDGELIDARREALPLLKEFRLSRRGGRMLPEKVCELLQSEIRRLLALIDTSREARDKMWGDCHSCDEPAWKAGFMDESENGFVRAVRLGYAKRSDWHGAADANPLDVA